MKGRSTRQFSGSSDREMVRAPSPRLGKIALEPQTERPTRVWACVLERYPRGVQ